MVQDETVQIILVPVISNQFFRAHNKQEQVYERNGKEKPYRYYKNITKKRKLKVTKAKSSYKTI